MLSVLKSYNQALAGFTEWEFQTQKSMAQEKTPDGNGATFAQNYSWERYVANLLLNGGCLHNRFTSNHCLA
jgi:hypothetical protein